MELTAGSLRELHAALVEPVLGPAIGASEAEVAALEAKVGPLARVYREALLLLGHDINGVFVGSDCFLRHLPSNQRGLVDLLERHQVDREPGKALCFFMHQGYMAAWFEMPSTVDDPDIWFFNEMEGPPRRAGPLSAFFIDHFRSASDVRGERAARVRM